MSFNMNSGGHNPNGDKEVNPPPGDGITKLAWSPNGQFLAGSSWDKQVRLWEIDQNGNSQAKAGFAHEAPCLAVTFNQDGSKVFSGGCDKKGMMWDLASNQQQQIAAHGEPINFVKWIPEKNVLMTGSWDKTIKYWDGRQSQPALTAELPGKLYSADVVGQLAVAATSNRKIVMYNLNNPNQPFRVIDSPLKFQTRAVRVFPDLKFFAISSIEGRVAIHSVDQSNASANFAFKCHRTRKQNNQKAQLFSVNDIAISKYGTFATMGGDGAFHFWDKEEKQRLQAFKNANLPVLCGTFNPNATVFAYAVGYDWSKGAQGYDQNNMKNHVLLHGVKEAEVMPKKKGY
eukprot:TRINITY_DN1518_c0_g1_i1.p1 TRINITY_DN1518_c0_g1~~TRINITY_DN1518_c0_g1_i1.p1  ORF type:complete len:344 (+),score=71.08 TRINITY_DN1518_c0_g1_i1:265-1296(+)